MAVDKLIAKIENGHDNGDNPIRVMKNGGKVHPRTSNYWVSIGTGYTEHIYSDGSVHSLCNGLNNGWYATLDGAFAAISNYFKNKLLPQTQTLKEVYLVDIEYVKKNTGVYKIYNELYKDCMLISFPTLKYGAPSVIYVTTAGLVEGCDYDLWEPMGKIFELTDYKIEIDYSELLNENY